MKTGFAGGALRLPPLLLETIPLAPKGFSSASKVWRSSCGNLYLLTINRTALYLMLISYRRKARPWLTPKRMFFRGPWT